MTRLVDSLLRGRAQPSVRNEAAAAVSNVRAFVHAWRPTSNSWSSKAPAGVSQVLGARQSGLAGGGDAGVGDGQGESRNNNSVPLVPNKPSADILLKLAQVHRPDERIR